MTQYFLPFLLFLSLTLNAQVKPKDSLQLNAVKDSTLTAINEDFILERGATIPIKLLTEINSKTTQEGDTICFSIFDDVTVGKQVVIKAGTLVTGSIEKAQKAQALGKAGELSYFLNYAKAVDGTKVYLKTSKSDLEGKSTLGGTIALAVIITPLFLFHKGKNVKMEAGKIVNAFVDRDYTIHVTE